MIYGLIPIGGQGTRLGLPFSKEMLPQKNYGFYNPVSNHLVQKMLLAGAEKIYFIHGKSIKQDVASYYADESRFQHVLQHELGFANVLKDFYLHSRIEDSDQCFFGLPDSVFDGNPFPEMLSHTGICAGLFTTSPSTKVDRLTIDATRFEVKTAKTDHNSEHFWGVIKFDGRDIRRFHEDDVYAQTREIGDILNVYGFEKVYGNSYIDIGTWENYNKYISKASIPTDSEIEKKYLANEVDPKSFMALFTHNSDFSYEHIVSADYYFAPSNNKVEFIRYREQPHGATLPSDITVKDCNSSPINRYELTIPLGHNVNTQSVLTFLSIISPQFEFKVEKDCHIFTSNEVVVVLYSFTVQKKKIQLIEIELLQADFNILARFEALLSQLKGFSTDNQVNHSKYKMIKEMFNDAAY